MSPGYQTDINKWFVIYWETIAKKSERSAKVVQILKDYSAVMNKAGNPYRCS